MDKSDSKRKNVVIDDDDDDNDDIKAEDWCFVCKDGGKLTMCDFKGCPKVYHRRCLPKKRRSSKPGAKWICSRHKCTKCCKPSVYDCFGCPKGLCKTCVKSIDFALIKNNKGLCEDCLTLARQIEQNAEFSEEGVLDFKDPSTIEGLFKGYLEIVMKEESFTFDDINAAYARIKKAAMASVKIIKGKDDAEILVIDDDDDDDDDGDCDYDDDSDEAEPETSDEKMETEPEMIELEHSDDDDFAVATNDELRVNYKKSTSKRQRVSNKNKSSHDKVVDHKTLAKSYSSNKVEHSEPKPNIFGIKPKCFPVSPQIEATLNETKKSLVNESKCKVKEEESFECLDDSENEVEAPNDANIESEQKDPGNIESEKKDPGLKTDSVLDSNINSQDKKASEDCQERCFASINVGNINLIYLRKGLLLKFINGTNNLEEKVVGCFVKKKNGPNKISHQLLQITGVTTNPLTSKILLQVLSSPPENIDLSLLSDDDITKDECEELRKKIKEGLVERPIVAELEQKARSLHEDITKHWIEWELARLQGRIGFLNEKGKRKEMEVHINKLALLKKESEQERLLNRLPMVNAEVEESL